VSVPKTGRTPYYLIQGYLIQFLELKAKKMEKRRSAAIVLSVLLLIGIVILYIHYRRKQTLSFSTCTVHISYIGKGYESDEYRIAKNRLALCLCSLYKKKSDTALVSQLITIYRQYGTHYRPDSLIYTSNIDSLIKNEGKVFDTTMVVD
jgi:hypothetical protein